MQLVHGDRDVLPREAFELWMYGGLLHNDVAKEQRLEALGPWGAAMARQIAVDYMGMLVKVGQAVWRVALEDPALAPA
jgi:hypothetical protein